MVASRECCEFGEMRCEPAPIGVAACDVFLYYIWLISSSATCEYSRGNSDFAQPLQCGDGDVKFDEYALLAVMGNKTGFLLPILWFGDGPTGCMKMRVKDGPDFVVHN